MPRRVWHLLLAVDPHYRLMSWSGIERVHSSWWTINWSEWRGPLTLRVRLRRFSFRNWLGGNKITLHRDDRGKVRVILPGRNGDLSEREDNGSWFSRGHSSHFNSKWDTCKVSQHHCVTLRLHTDDEWSCCWLTVDCSVCYWLFFLFLFICFSFFFLFFF